MRADRGAFRDAFDVSRETMDRFDTYETLLKKWNPKINLVSRATLDHIWQRHFMDSAQIFRQTGPAQETWLDFGTGAGFPGLVVAVLAGEKRPALRVTLVESDQRKAAFLLSVARALALDVEVITSRIEALPPRRADVISARAVAPLDQLLHWAAPHAHKSTVLLFPKGNSYESELTAAQKHWHIEAKAIPSVTDSSSVILRIEDFERVV